MIKGILDKTLVIGVIVLFIGIGIQPAFAVAPETTDIKEDCNLCAKKVSKQHMVRLKNVVDRLEKFDTQLSIISKHLPEFKEKYQEVSDRVNILSEINEIYLSEMEWNNPIICGIIGVVYGSLSLIWNFIGSVFYSLPWPLDKFIAIIGIIVGLSLMSIISISFTMDCWWI